jgi:hypothetical protein
MDFRKSFSPKPFDFVILGFSLALTVFSGLLLYPASRSAARVLIQGADRSWVFPADAEERVSVPGPLGDTVVEIRGGRARVFSSPCDNQTCVAAGHIHRQGQWVACLPNQVFVAIEGNREGDQDAPVDAAAW